MTYRRGSLLFTFAACSVYARRLQLTVPSLVLRVAASQPSLSSSSRPSLLALLCFSCIVASTSAYSWAVCLTGELRTTTHPMVVANLRARLIHSLPSADTVDVFAVLGAGDEDKAEALYAALPELVNRTSFLAAPAFNGSQPYAFAERFDMQCSKVDACFQRVQTHERFRGQRYHFFLRARSDLFYWYPVSNWLTTNNSIVQTGMSTSGGTPTDHFASMPRHLASVYAAAGEVVYDPLATPDRLLQVASLRQQMGHCPLADYGMWPECLITGWLALRGVLVVAVCGEYERLWVNTGHGDVPTEADQRSAALQPPPPCSRTALA